MDYKNFLYRQKQRLRYHTTTDATLKRIAEINQYKKRISVDKSSFLIEELDLVLPYGFEFVFDAGNFDYLISNATNLKGNYEIFDGRLLFAFNNRRVEITSGSELFIINEILVEKCYNFRLPGSEKVIVMDVGLNVGLASLFFADHDQVERVYSYEPFLLTFRKAEFNLGLNPQLAGKISLHNFGLGLRDETLSVKFDPVNTGINSTLLENPKQKPAAEEKILVKAAKPVAANIIKDNPGKKILLKIDTEGAEYPIFENLFSERLADNIIAFMVEWHFNGPGDLETKLLQEGFKLNSFTINKNSGLIYAFR